MSTLLTHDNMEMTGDPVRYLVTSIEVLETRRHPDKRMQRNDPEVCLLVSRVRVAPWNVICWAWTSMVVTQVTQDMESES
jgi:hypothetical protein